MRTFFKIKSLLGTKKSPTLVTKLETSRNTPGCPCFGQAAVNNLAKIDIIIGTFQVILFYLSLSPKHRYYLGQCSDEILYTITHLFSK